MKMIEVHDMVIKVLGATNQISDDAGILGRFDLEGIFTGHNSGFVMYIRADTSETLDKEPRIPWIASPENGVDATP